MCLLPSRYMEPKQCWTKEIVELLELLQNFGKADKTIDEMFDRYVDNFIKQQNIALKLQKELRNYIICVKAMQVASKSLMETISEVYEDKWINSDQIPVKCQILETLWEDYCQKINEAVAAPLNSYLNQFPDMKVGKNLLK
ncbi:amphiphysin-like isoform X1 [Centruroides sculpturatus]|uniref:amphiphysin-like isoform X1 n=1 Tax=Centruroides sculpturatus TaxID=218467 RepID=UPI000C6D6A5D|nr:amphiphysin-like isoform X1 [Centruroides sculpturatus]